MNDTSEVKLHFLDYWRVIRVRSGIVTLTFLLVMVTAGITTYFLPREFMSKVVIEVKSDNERLKIFSNEGARGAMDPRLSSTQFQIIRSKEILYSVIDNLGLIKKWSTTQPLTRDQTYVMLLNKLDMRDVRNTDLIEIGVYDTNAQEAADIANTIAVVYQEKRRGDQQQLLNRGLGQLDEEIAKQRKKVEQAQAEVAKLRSDQGIVDLNPETIETTETTDTLTVRADELKADEARVALSSVKTQIEQISSLKPEELMVALHTLNLEDPTVAKVLPLYQDSVVEEARLLSSGLGQRHPRVTALRAAKEVYAKQLNDAISALRNSLSTKMRITQAQLSDLEKKLASSKDAYSTGKVKSKEYIEAKGAYIQAKKVLESAELRLSTERMEQQITMNPAKIWEKAEPAQYPSKPNVPAYMALSVLIGLVVGVGLAFFIEYLDTSVKTMEDVEKFLGLPVLAVIPKGIGLLHKQTIETSDAEAYRILRTNMEFNRKTPDAKSITLLSGGPGEGKSTTILNLAYTCAKGGYKVLVVDADVRRPSQHTLLGINNSKGLVNYLQGNMTLEQITQPTVIENLSFVPSGILPAEAVGILNSQRLADLVLKTKREYDLVFFDSPPILGVSDGSVLASEVDICIMVIEHRRFPRSMVQRVKQAILSVGGNPLGVVLNKVDTKHDQSYQYYTNYYDYYTPRQTEKTDPKAAKVSIAPRRSAQSSEEY